MNSKATAFRNAVAKWLGEEKHSLIWLSKQTKIKHSTLVVFFSGKTRNISLDNYKKIKDATGVMIEL